MLGYVDAKVIEPACVRVPVGRDRVGADGLVADPDVRTGLAAQIATVAAAVGRATANSVDPSAAPG